MTIIFLTEYNTKCYGVTFQNKGWINVQKFAVGSLDKNIIYTVNPLKTFLGKSRKCEMTALSGAFDKMRFDGKTILLEVAKENDDYRYIYIGGDMICSFLTDDNLYKYVSNMSNDLFPYSRAIGDKNVYFLTPHFKFISKALIDDDKLMKTGEDIDDLFDYFLSNCEKDTFEKIQICKILFKL